MAVGAQEKGTDAAEKPSGDITEEMAKKIAMKDAGLDEGSCKVVKCRKEMDYADFDDDDDFDFDFD